MDDCLQYFKQVVTAPGSVPVWSEWWSQHEELVRRTFPRLDYVRLKHRRLAGARQLLERAGRLPRDFEPPRASTTGYCTECGERVAVNVCVILCPNCGVVATIQIRPRPDLRAAAQD